MINLANVTRGKKPNTKEYMLHYSIYKVQKQKEAHWSILVAFGEETFAVRKELKVFGC